MKRLFSVITVCVLALSAFAPMASASSSTPAKMTPEQARVLGQQLLDQADKAANDALVQYAKKPRSGMTPTTSAVMQPAVSGSCGTYVPSAPTTWDGTTTGTYYFADAYGCGTSTAQASWAYTAAGTGAQTSFADSECTGGGYGNCDAWAWTGFTVNYTGSQNKTAYVTVTGGWSGSLLVGPAGGSASARVRVSIWDQTMGSETSAAVLVFNQSATTYTPLANQYSGRINAPLTVTFVPNHVYIVRVGVDTAIAVQGTSGNDANFYDGTNSLPGTTLESVSLQ